MPVMLDLFCCQGGAAVGYHRAGFAVVGVDRGTERSSGNGYTLGPLRHYPFPYYHGDALDYVAAHGHEYDAIHASPPCQGYTRGNAGKVTQWPKLIPAVREALEATGRPYVIENVADARPAMVDPVMLCGCMFGLHAIDTDGVRVHLRRQRLFEANFPLAAPRPCDHSGIEWWAGAYGGARRDKHDARHVRRGGYVPADKAVVAALLGVDHPMTWAGLFECLPPAYTHHVGHALLAHLLVTHLAATTGADDEGAA